MEQALELISLYFAAMLKFAYSPAMGYAVGYKFWHMLIITSVGGLSSLFVFYYSAGWLMHRAFKRRLKKAMENKKPKKIFTRKNKMIVKVKRGSGMNGLAALTPPLISIPIGAIIAAKYFYGQRRTLPLLVGSTLVWAFLLSSFWWLLIP